MSYHFNGGFIGKTKRVRMPITFVGGSTQVSAGGTTDLTMDLTTLSGGIGTRPLPGDVIIVGFGSASTVNVDFSTKITGSGFTNISELYANDTLVDTNLIVGYKVVGSTPDTSLTITGGTGATTDGGAIGVHVWRYVDPVTPLDVTSTTATSITNANVNPPAITPVTAGAMIVAVGAGGHDVFSTQRYYSASITNTTSVYFFSNLGVGGTYDCLIGIAAHEGWTSGSYDPSAWRLSLLSGGSSHAVVTLALRPKYPGTLSTGSTGMWSVDSLYQNLRDPVIA